MRSNLKKSFTFSLKEGVSILHIYSVEDAMALPMISEVKLNDISRLFGYISPEFEALINAVIDAVELFDKPRMSLIQILPGWDCDTLLVMKNEIIVPMETKE